MNIGFFTDCYLPQIDGVVRSILLFKKTLEKRGHNVFVFAPKEIKSEIMFRQKLKNEDEKNVFRFKAINSVFIPGYPIALPLSLRASYKIPKLKLDIVHSHTPIILGMLANFVAFSENIPIVSTYHTYYSEYAKHYWPIKGFKKTTARVVQKFEIFYYNRVNHVIVPSLKLKKILQKFGVENKITILPTGIDFEEFRKGNPENFRKKWKISAKKKIILYVGRLNTEKNLEFLFKAIGKLINEPDIIFVIIGDGKGRKDLEKLAQDLGFKDKILFCGFCSREETIDGFLACDVFVFASKTDTQGLVLGEAVAAGKPVVMIRDLGLCEIVKNNINGFEVKENIFLFAKKVLKLLRDKTLYARMSQNSKKIVKDFLIEKQTKKLEELYQKVIDEYDKTSWRRRMWRELNKEYKIRDLFNKLLK